MSRENLIKSRNIRVTARELDFATRFERTWEHLREILGIMRPVKKQPGTKLKSKYAAGSLMPGNVGEGEEIPYSHFEVKEKDYKDVEIEKYSKAVSIEAIKDHGYENAVQMTDDAFLFELQTEVTGRFYAYLNSGELKSTESTFQMALAMAKGRVLSKFKKMKRAVTGVVGFVNVLDVYKYLGTAEITIQNEFGFQYIKNFMGYSVVFLLGDDEIPQGRVIATAVENIAMYFVDPSDSDFAKADLEYTTAGGETDLIGVHAQGNYKTAVSELFAIMGVYLFAEYIDAIAVIDIAGTYSGIGTLTVASAAGSTEGTTKITATPEKSPQNNYKYKVADDPISVYPGMVVKNWMSWDGSKDIKAEAEKTITVVECNAAYEAVKAGSKTVVSNNSL